MTTQTDDSSRRPCPLVGSVAASRARRAFGVWLVGLVIMIFPAFRATAQVGAVVKIALSGDSAPNLVGTIGGGNNPVLSNSGVVAFTTLTLNNERAILTGSGGFYRVVVC